MNDNWVLVDGKNYPKEKEIVQITFKAYVTDELTCLRFAYRKNGKWLCDDYDGDIYEIEEDRVIAWRDCIPYGYEKAPTI